MTDHLRQLEFFLGGRAEKTSEGVRVSFNDLTHDFSDNNRLAVFVWMVAEDLDRVVAVRRELFDGGGYLDFVDRLPAA